MNPTQETYTELQTAYNHFNQILFNGELPWCLITLQREKKCIAGYFSAARFMRHDKSRTTDEIAMNPMQFMTMPIIENLKTLAHEMVHQWQYHFGDDKSRQAYHNREWGEKMKSIGLYPSSTGEPDGKESGQKMSEYVIPGGPFEKCAAALMTQDFVLSWGDRGGVVGMVGDVAVVEDGPEGPAENRDTRAGAPDQKGQKSGVRVKYYCPRCGVNVWGKSELNIICGSCGVGFNQH